MSLNLFTGIAFVTAGLALLWREILLSPREAPTFPCAPLAVRVAMFMVGAGTLFVGALFFDRRHPFAGEAAGVVGVLAGAVALYQLVMLGNILLSRRSPRLWARIRRMDAASQRTERIYARPVVVRDH